MSGRSRVRFGIQLGLASCLLTSITLVGALSCGAPTAVLVNGPGGEGNTPPTLTITEPVANIIVGQGTPFLIRWTDSDPDDNAQIGFDLVNTTTNAVVPLVAGLAENDQVGPDSHTAGTTLIPIGAYNLRGSIDDGVNPAVTVFAVTAGTTPQRVVVRILEEGSGEQGVPPRFIVTEPLFDQSVTQEDVVNVVVAPPAPGVPFDPDSDATLYIVFDTDLDPNNDDPANPNPTQIIVMSTTTIALGAVDALTIPIRIDLTTVPPRAEGAPYFIRATADDGTNPRVHQYAVGTIHVTQLAAGVVDLFAIGRQLSGTRWYGFNPGANAGSTVRNIGDFDGDGVQDFIIVARFGNPRNAGQVGEAYMVYGLDGIRFGGTISVNSVTETVSGVLFEAPPIRTDPLGFFPIPGTARSDGITDVAALPDFTADGRPEIIFGLPRVHGAFDSTDFDPGDQAQDEGENEEVEVVLRQNEVTIQVGDGNPIVVSEFFAVEDTYISASEPATSFGSSTSLGWQNDGGAQRRWTLIKFADVLDQIPDSPFLIDITTVEATLELRVFDLGGQANVHLSFSDFDELTTYNDYAANGGDPQEGVDFRVEPEGANGQIAQVDGNAAGTVEVDVTLVVRELLDGVLDDDVFENELRFLLAPVENDSEDLAQVRSGEFGNEPDRPTLRIAYERISNQGALGCYPDDLVNNLADSGDPDLQWYAGGMAVVVNSTNRDSDGIINPARLEETVVTLELSGQRPFVLDSSGLDPAGGDIFTRADNSFADDAGSDVVENGRIAGARFIAGPFDFEDHLQLRQPARDDLFGQQVGTLGDINNDGLGEIVISAPRNERYLADLFSTYGFASTHLTSTIFRSSVVVLPGTNYNLEVWRDINDTDGTATIPTLDHHRFPPTFGSCQIPPQPRHQALPAGTFGVFAENIDDMLGGAGSAGDFNQDGLDDLICGAYRNDRPGNLTDTGAVYVLYSRNVLADFNLTLADDPLQRPPMLRIRGATRGDQAGWRQTSGRDVNGDRIEDVFLSSPRTDYGGVTRSACGTDFDDDGSFDQDDLNIGSFNLCQQQFGNDLFRGDACKAFDYDNDNDIDDDDRCIFCCLSDDCAPDGACVFGRTPTACCEAVVDNGFAAVIFGGRFVDGDRTINQIATADLPGVVFYGGRAGDRAGMDISSAGDFNQDGFGDIMIAVPGESRRDSAGRLRVGVVYLIFGGTHLNNTTWSLSDPERGVGSVELPGIVFFSPYVEGRPNEAAPETVGLLGDINNDGFDDVAIGNPKADFIDLSLPQGPDAPGTDAEAGRRRDTGDVYIIYGSNFGSNRGSP